MVPEEKVIVAGDDGSRSTQSKSLRPVWRLKAPIWIHRGIRRAAAIRAAHSCAKREPTNAFGCTRWRTCSISLTGSHGSTKRTTMPRPRNPRIVAYNRGSGGDRTRTVSPAVSPSAEARDWAPAESVPISLNEAQPSLSVHTAGEVARSPKWLSTRFVQFIRCSSYHRGCVL